MSNNNVIALTEIARIGSIYQRRLLHNLQDAREAGDLNRAKLLTHAAMEINCFIEMLISDGEPPPSVHPIK